MQFGKHTPAATKDRHQQSPMAVFTRGLQMPGQQWTFKFSNGFGASVINDGYGAENGCYELAVLGPDGHLTYETPVTDDVLGWLTEEQVVDALDQIEALTPDAIATESRRRIADKRAARIAEFRAELAELEMEAEATR